MAAGTIEKIQVVLQSLTSGFAKGLGRAQTQLKSVGKNMQEFGAVMAMPMKNFKEINDNMKATQNIGGKVAKRFRMMTHGMRGFRMEALGVMFFGMMMQKMFMNLLQPVMEAFGVFDIFRLMLLTLFLPIMEMIFPFLLAMMEWFMDLPDPVKKAIGIFVILGLIFGTIIMIIGQFALGVGSLILMFAAGFGWIIGVVGAFIAVFAGIILIVKGVAMIFKKKFEGIGLVIMGVGAILLLFIGWWALIPIAVGYAVYLIIKHWERVKAFFKRFWDSIVKGFKWLVDKIVGFFKWLYNKIVGHSIIPDMIKAIIFWFWKLPKEVFKMFASIVAKMFKIGVDIIQGMINGIRSLGRKVIDAILSLFPKWMRKGIEAAGKITINIIKSVTEKVKSVFGGGSKNDFIWRPGQGAISINPNDTLVGFKGSPPNLGGGGGGGDIIQENNFYGFTMDDLSRELDDRDRRLVDDIRRLVKT